MHIVYVTREYPPSLRGGGIASYVKEMAHGLSQKGHQVTVIAASDDTSKSSEYIDDGVRVIRLSGGDFVIPQVEGKSLVKKFRMFYRFYSYRKKVLEAVRHLENVDIIEVPDFGAEGYFLHQLAVPVVTRLHTPAMFDRNTMGITKYHGLKKIFEWTGKKELRLIKNCRYLSSCSNALAEWVVSNLNIERNIVKVIYNPVSLPKELESSSLVCDCILSITYVGTISEVKGCGDLFEAGKILYDKGVKFNIYLYGKMGVYAYQLQKLEKTSSWFHVMGKVNREDIFDIYKNASVVCFPSWWDNMPMVCLEAMGVGAMVLGSSYGGMKEIIQDGKNGFLIEPHDPQCLAAKIIDIVNLSESERRKISSNAIKRIQNNFSKDVILNQMVDYYQGVISEFKKSRI